MTSTQKSQNVYQQAFLTVLACSFEPKGASREHCSQLAVSKARIYWVQIKNACSEHFAFNMLDILSAGMLTTISQATELDFTIDELLSKITKSVRNSDFTYPLPLITENFSEEILVEWVRYIADASGTQKLFSAVDTGVPITDVFA